MFFYRKSACSRLGGTDVYPQIHPTCFSLAGNDHFSDRRLISGHLPVLGHLFGCGYYFAGWLAGLTLRDLVGLPDRVNLVGQVSLRWVWKGIRTLSAQRLLGTAIGALIPLLILLPIGYSVEVGDIGSRFYDLVTNHWQPILAQGSLFAAILGFFIPGMFTANNPSAVTN